MDNVKKENLNKVISLCSQIKDMYYNNAIIMNGIATIEKKCNSFLNELSLDVFMENYEAQLEMLLKTQNEKGNSNLKSIYMIITNHGNEWDSWAEFFTGISIKAYEQDIDRSVKEVLMSFLPLHGELGNVIKHNEDTVTILSEVTTHLKNALEFLKKYAQNNDFVSSPVYTQILTSIKNGSGISQYKTLLKNEKNCRVQEFLNYEELCRNELILAIIGTLTVFVKK